MGQGVSTKEVEIFTRKKIKDLFRQAKGNTKVLAELRRGVGKTPGEVPQLWGYFLEEMPEKFYGNKEPSRAEWAVYTALTLLALHQQGKDPDTNSMHKEGQIFGKAISGLVHDVGDKDRVAKRFNTIATANSMEELSHYMRGMVQLLRSGDIGLDYVKLAGDIYQFQFPEFVSNVRLRWGQDFYRITSKRNDDEN